MAQMRLDSPSIPFGLLLILVLFPFDQLLRIGNFIDADLPIRITQLIAGGMLILSLAQQLLRGRIKRWSSIGWLFALYLAQNIISLAYTPNKEYGVRQLLVFLTWPLIYLAVVEFLKHERHLFSLLRIIILIAYVNAAFSIVQVVVFWATGFTLGILPETTGDHLRGRAYGFYLEPNWFGVYQLCIIPILHWAYINFREIGLSRRTQMIGAGLFGLSWILAQNRGAVLAIAFQLAAFYVLTRQKQPIRIPGRTLAKRIVQTTLVCVGAIAIIGSSVNFLPAGLKEQITVRLVENLVSSEESAAGGRLVAYGVLWQNIIRSPLIGQGIASWVTMVQGWRIVDDNNVQANVTAPNEYLRLLAEDGILGFSLMMGIVFIILRRLLKARRHALPTSHQLLTALSVSFIGFLAIGNFYGVRGMVSALPLIGLYVAVANLYNKANTQLQGTKQNTDKLCEQNT